jgi:hypothetical protein
VLKQRVFLRLPSGSHVHHTLNLTDAVEKLVWFKRAVTLKALLLSFLNCKGKTGEGAIDNNGTFLDPWDSFVPVCETES